MRCAQRQRALFDGCRCRLRSTPNAAQIAIFAASATLIISAAARRPPIMPRRRWRYVRFVYALRHAMPSAFAHDAAAVAMPSCAAQMIAPAFFRALMPLPPSRHFRFRAVAPCVMLTLLFDMFAHATPIMRDAGAAGAMRLFAASTAAAALPPRCYFHYARQLPPRPAAMTLFHMC